MKQVKCKFPVRILTLLLGLFLSVSAFAQSTITGQVKDATGEPVIGASVLINGTSNGTVTDLDGNFSVNVQPGATLTISYIGFQKQQVAATNGMVITLQEDQAQQMNEVVVIGYGAVKKSDLTGSVTALKPDSKNKGLVVNAQDMLAGKVAGVSVTSDGGTPGGGSNIRIRGGSSLNASNNPLIVIDGVAMDQTGVKGVSNPLSLVNPQDIESFNVLKDASATAIYGSRGSNGVIIITTKKGRRGLQVSYNGSFTVSRNSKNLDVLSADEYRSLIAKKFGTDLYTLDSNGNKVPTAYSRLGNANTNWQNEIFRTALSHDHNVAVSGQVGDWLPYRVSAGYTNQQGIIKTSNFERFTGALTLNPSFLNDHLKITLNAKGMWTKNRYADGEAIKAARQFDPTQPVYASGYDNFGGYYQWLDDGTALNDRNWPKTYYNLATKNPVSILNLKNDRAISRDFLGSADFDYKVHGFEDLRLHVTAGIDIAKGRQVTDVEPTSPQAIYYGSYGWESQLKRNMQLSAYAQYYHDFNDKAKNHFDIMAGYEWAHFWHNTHNSYWSYYPKTNNNTALAGTERNRTYYDYATENYLVSFFSRANWSLMDGRYMVTATVRNDGSSRFKEHWATFPSFAFAWRVNEENLFKKIDWLSDLKLRLSWGMTGQQEGIGDYNYFAIYEMNTGNESTYPTAGNGSLARPKAYDPNLKWETTTSYNVGLDWGILKQRLTGSVDWYYRKTTDLLNSATVPAGSNFRNQVMSNIGSMYNMGVETSLHWLAVNAKDFNWTMDYNFTYNYNKITNLNGGNDPDYFVPTGGISAGTGGNIQAQHVGNAVNSFHVFQQAYDKNGKPLEGVVVDRNGDGKITDADKYYYKAPAAPVTMGFASRFEYRNWDLGFALRASLGNYVYNDAFASTSNMSNSEIYVKSKFLVNRPTDVVADNWSSTETTSTQTDYWVQNASFLKMDNVTLGYSFANLLKQGSWNGITGRIYGTVNNVFCLTKYKGLDPEVFNGIDNNLYPRPISFILGLNLNF
ncbi:TonB-dependent receptor [Prevotella melaninogenica]|uniref:SusC/RagA family TonB-linked outer membrane protein n=1 Tax=Prevotella TaxID=838 RepID=UPI0003AD3B79|nr:MULTISPECIES: TonB-dependent receptor [Prevotella]ERJ77230.1 TonB-dependent receptor plug domain protein [Prevotella sp. F0091]QUB74402.1 TonB-dependent receptor [Prevotella melaninogenica]